MTKIKLLYFFISEILGIKEEIDSLIKKKKRGCKSTNCHLKGINVLSTLIATAFVKVFYHFIALSSWFCLSRGRDQWRIWLHHFQLKTLRPLCMSQTPSPGSNNGQPARPAGRLPSSASSQPTLASAPGVSTLANSNPLWSPGGTHHRRSWGTSYFELLHPVHSLAVSFTNIATIRQLRLQNGGQRQCIRVASRRLGHRRCEK